MSIAITNLFLYPVKSTAPFEVESMSFEAGKPKYDRDWVIVNSNLDQNFNIVLTQREEPRLSLIKPRVDSQGNLSLSAKGLEKIDVPLA